MNLFQYIIFPHAYKTNLEPAFDYFVKRNIISKDEKKLALKALNETGDFEGLLLKLFHDYFEKYSKQLDDKIAKERGSLRPSSLDDCNAAMVFCVSFPWGFGLMFIGVLILVILGLEDKPCPDPCDKSGFDRGSQISQPGFAISLIFMGLGTFFCFGLCTVISLIKACRKSSINNHQNEIEKLTCVKEQVGNNIKFLSNREKINLSRFSIFSAIFQANASNCISIDIENHPKAKQIQALPKSVLSNIFSFLYSNHNVSIDNCHRPYEVRHEAIHQRMPSVIHESSFF